MNEKLNIILNGKNVIGFKGETILKLAERHNIEIPTLCNDNRLEPYTSCYLCVVEVQGMKGLQPACSTRITEGMNIVTHNDKIFTSRKTALELLLSNHYADCVAPCKQTCPAGVDVQGYISYIEKGMFHEAVELIKETNPLPAVCGRVCVRPCEVACRRNLLDENHAVGIDYMKRFAADFDLQSPNKFKPKINSKSGKKVAIIGAGPGGLSAAFFLQKKGHQCDIFEASPKGGGWLRYGIPEYRLPNDILQKEIDNITELGVNIHYNKKLGDNLSYNDIKAGYDATILAVGSQIGTNVGCEGDDANNVFSGVDFLKQMELTGEKMDFTGKTVAVVGGGNTAMDCCRTAIRFGAKKVYVVYRRTEKEMPANPIEIHESKLEGVEYMFLTAPVKINKDSGGNLQSMTCIKMQLGEPDASGRRRPVPVDGSDFDLQLDFILAAIGQKTTLDFINDVNAIASDGELKANKWGDIDVIKETLQTGIKSMFACGDGVTGPATLIEAIGQAKIAAKSCHQFLMGQEIKPDKKEFLSKKDNFKKQLSDDYSGHFTKQEREEMPVLNPADRNNFNEVELGYHDANIAKNEANRCLECGCSELFSCDLKKYATEYNVDQKKFGGSFKEYKVDFRHPFIEIDNNKCILCSRCVRICREVVGASALGLVKRGFETYVAPSLGNSLTESNCESCGMCISTCPTGAITENVNFKPGPVKLSTLDTICNYCSVGCAITLHHKNGYVMKVTGRPGLINKEGNICRFAKFGYGYINDASRITKPLLRVNDEFKEISFSKAYEIISEKIKSVNADENAFYAGARLCNEEMFQLQKLARAGAKTNNINSFHYMNGSNGYINDSRLNVPLQDINVASAFYLLGAELNTDNAVVSFAMNNARLTANIPLKVVSNKSECLMAAKADNLLKVKSYYHFVKAVNHYLLSNGLENAFYIKDHCTGFDDYKEKLLKEDFKTLITVSGIDSAESIQNFAENFNNEINAIMFVSEKDVPANTMMEIFNLMMITGKLGKTASGLIVLKEKNNAHGIFDMGCRYNLTTGSQFINDAGVANQLKEKWAMQTMPEIPVAHEKLLDEGKIKNAFIFGEDPVGCSMQKEKTGKWFNSFSFIVVQDYFLTETAQKADLILPASLPFEIGGSFTNTQKMIQEFHPEMPSAITENSYMQIAGILRKMGIEASADYKEIFMEIIKHLPNETVDNFEFRHTEKDNNFRLFKFGCDSLVKRFEEYFYNSLLN